MGKYFSGADKAFGTLQGPGCGGLGKGYINDIVAEMCWAVDGAPIVIGDTAFSIQAGFEMTNFNFRVDSSSPAVPTLSDLPGPYGGGN